MTVSIRTRITLKCEGVACKEKFRFIGRTPQQARRAARILNGWGTRQRRVTPGPVLDLCPACLARDWSDPS